ncbi:MAG: hypothetical protein ACRC46_02110 [Thermoguttaceae bacterium]
MTILSGPAFVERLFEVVGEPVAEFQPFAFHNTDGDCIEFFVSPEDYFAERIDDYLTLYLDLDTEQVVGFVVKNVKRILADLACKKAALAFVVDDGRVRLRSLFVAIFSDSKLEARKQDIIVREYSKVVNIAESYHLDEIELLAIA